MDLNLQTALIVYTTPISTKPKDVYVMIPGQVMDAPCIPVSAMVYALAVLVNLDRSALGVSNMRYMLTEFVYAMIHGQEQIVVSTRVDVLLHVIDA